MKKIFLAIMFALAPIGALAQIANPGWFKDDPVDYRRLRLPTDEPAIPCFFTMEVGKADDHTQVMAIYLQRTLKQAMATAKFTTVGSIVHTWNITPEFVEACIQKALDDSSIRTRAELARLIASTPYFKDFTYTNDQWMSDMFSLVTGAAGFIIPSGTASTIYGLTTGAVGMVLSNTSGSASAADNALSGAGLATNVIPGNISSGVGNALSAASLFKTIYAQYERDVQKWDNRTYILNMCRIDYFYHLANMYLRSYANSFDRVWVINLPDIDKTTPFQFRGVMCQANWHFRLGALRLLYLDRKQGDLAEYDFEGEYFGFLNGEVNFDLSNYDKDYLSNTEYQELLGANGNTDNPFINAAERMKGIATTDALRGTLNLCRALTDFYVIKDIVNESGTDMWVSYNSPIHFTVEVPTNVEDRMVECSPHYFWDNYETEYSEMSVRTSDVMRAMGISIGSRDSEVKAGMQVNKGFTAYEKYGDGVEMAYEEVSGGEYTYTTDKTRESVPVKTVVGWEEVPTTIPSGMLRILWTSEIDPPSREPREILEKDWGELFKKYNLVFKY